MWFLWLNWRKSTFYPITAPNDSKCWPIMTSSIQEPAVSHCDVTMTNCFRVVSPGVSMDAFLAQWCWGQLNTSWFYIFVHCPFFFGPRVSTRGIASHIKKLQHSKATGIFNKIERNIRTRNYCHIVITLFFYTFCPCRARKQSPIIIKNNSWTLTITDVWWSIIHFWNMAYVNNSFEIPYSCL